MEVNALVSFGQDACARLYTVSLTGPVSRIRDGEATSCDLPEPSAPSIPPPAPGGASPPVITTPDRTGPRLSVRRSARQRIRGGRTVKLTVTVSEPATVRASLRVAGAGTLRSASRTLAAGTPRVFRVSTRGSAGQRVRRAVARRSRLATLTVTARDAAGNVSRTVRRVRLR